MPHDHEDLDERFPEAVACERQGDVDPFDDDHTMAGGVRICLKIVDDASMGLSRECGRQGASRGI